MQAKIKKMTSYPVTVVDAVMLGDRTSKSLGDILSQFILQYDYNVKSINHRGYSQIAPENTLAAFKLSKSMGYKYVEADISMTADGIAVLSHDATIDRCSNGTGTISEMTLEELRQYDFGSWKSEEYTGELIPTFEEFLLLCKALALHPYIELKSNGNYSADDLTNMVALVKKYGMQGKVTWISFNIDYLNGIHSRDNTARIGYLASVSETSISRVLALKGDSNEIFLDVNYTTLTDDLINSLIENNIPLEVWTVNDEAAIAQLNNYCTGVTSDCLNYGKYLYNKYM